MIKEQADIFDIQMFGRFTLSYQGKEYVLGRNTTAKFIQLLQIVWLHQGNEISKETLVNSLYERETLFNPNNSFNNLLYQMRKQMRRVGLPHIEYVVKKGRCYCVDPSLSVKVDVLEFYKFINHAEEAEDDREKYKYYLRAFELYKGELLPTISTETWVMLGNLQIKGVFENCVRWLGNYLKTQRDYGKMYDIYTRAAEYYPFDEWQVHQIDALLSMNEYKEAYQLYDKTVHCYSDEMGLLPSKQMLEYYERMSRKMEYTPGNIEEVKDLLQSKIEHRSEECERAYYCSYPGFVDAYHLLRRNMERSGLSVYLMLCTLVDYEGKAIENQEKLKLRSEALREAIGFTLRESDAYTKYSNSQYLILLINLKKEDCKNVHRRISKRLKELTGPRAVVKYNVSSLAELIK